MGIRWKDSARKLRAERNQLMVENAKQKRLLLWLLDQITAEAQAADELWTETEAVSGVHRTVPPAKNHQVN